MIFDDRILLEEEWRDGVDILGVERERWAAPALVKPSADLQNCIANGLDLQSAPVGAPQQLLSGSILYFSDR